MQNSGGNFMPVASAKSVQTDVLACVRRGLEGVWGEEVADLTTMNIHQRVYSRVLHCRVALRGGTVHHVIVKIYEPSVSADRLRLERMIVNDFEITSALNQYFSASEEFAVPVPLFHSPADLVIVTRFMPGVQLQEKIVARLKWWPYTRTVRELEGNCHACGGWLKAFQEATRDENREGVSFENIRDLVENRLGWMTDSPRLSMSASQRNRILKNFEAIIDELRLDNQAVSGLHGDYFPGNVLVDGNKIVGLDFAMYRKGSVFADVSYFWYQLETLGYKPQFSNSVVRGLQDAFLRGYDAELNSARIFEMPAFRLFYAFNEVMRLAGFLTLKNPAFYQKIYNYHAASKIRDRLLSI